MKQKLKSLINTTSGQIFISSMLVMTIAFLCIGGYLYKNLSGYILQQSSKYIETTVKQAQERFNSSLTEIDSNIQRFCNDLSVQTILNDYNQNVSFSSENFSTLRLKTMNTINYADNLESIELYSKKTQIYPYTKEPVDASIPDTALAMADEYNGKAVWLLSESGEGHAIMAVKRILLADYAFEHGGYVVVRLKTDLIDSIAQDLNALGDCTLELTDCAGNRVSYGKAQVFEKELLRTKAEITALQSQVNPHFIINALESVYWSLIQKNDMDNAEILMAMAKLFQYILKGEDHITIDQELTFVEQYLQVEKFRFGDRLSWEYSVDPDARAIQIPKLLIHPLVENSMKYAVECSSAPIHIVIRISRLSDGCVVSVTDNGPGIDPETMERIQESFKNTNPVGSVSKSYGLANLYKRIKLYFEKSSELTIESEPENRRTTVTLWLHTEHEDQKQ